MCNKTLLKSVLNVLIFLGLIVQFSSAGKWKIFVLAGQSNMEGYGEIGNTSSEAGTLKWTVVDQTARDSFPSLTKNGSWIITESNGNINTRDDVFIYYKRGGSEELKGGLTSGYGANSGTIGPELGFGHVMGEHYQDTVLLIKVAEGGKALGDAFLPPTSDGATGPNYTKIITDVSDVTQNLGTHFPQYQDQGYEIVGFGWHQGWNDRTHQPFSDAYEVNMKNLIEDLRKDLNTPEMLVVIPIQGIIGWAEANPLALEIIRAQLAIGDPTQHPEFAGKVSAIETRYWYYDGAASPGTQLYHWNQNAMTYLQIGQAMGDSMIALLPTQAVIRGCTDSLAPNFNPTATEDDGSCLPVSVHKNIKANFDFEMNTWEQGIWVTVNNPGTYQIKIYDLHGSVIKKHKGFISSELKLTLDVGVYVIQMTSNSDMIEQVFSIHREN